MTSKPRTRDDFNVYALAEISNAGQALALPHTGINFQAALDLARAERDRGVPIREINWTKIVEEVTRTSPPPPVEAQPLPEVVRRCAGSYIVARLGDALMADGSGTVSTEGGVRTWHVTVRRQRDGQRRGELHISEDGRDVTWTPA
jgi:hypothetical protein